MNENTLEIWEMHHIVQILTKLDDETSKAIVDKLNKEIDYEIEMLRFHP